MIEKPAFKSTFHVEIVEPEGVLLLSENEPIRLNGELLCRVAHLLNGSNTADQIVDALDGVPPEVAYYQLMMLEKKGYITGSDRQSIPQARAAYWEMLALDPHIAEGRLAEATVSVFDFGSVPVRHRLESALASMKISSSETGASFSVVIVDDYLQNELRAFNSASLSSGTPWLLVKPTGTILWIGPVFRPGQTACWECMAQRIEINRRVESFVHRRRHTNGSLAFSRASLPPVVETGLQMAATETAKSLTQLWIEQSEVHLVALNTLTLETRRHTVVRRPQCPQCGSVASFASNDPRPERLFEHRVQVANDAGQRIVSPGETYSRFKHHISPVTGAVSHLERLSADGDPYIHVYESSHNYSTARAGNLQVLRDSLRMNSGGKGVTIAQAKTSALCEALERYSGLYQGDEITVSSTLRRLGESALHPNECMLFSERQFSRRVEWNRECSAFQRVPEYLDDSDDLEWTPVWSLTRKMWRYLPTSYCYYEYPESRGAPQIMADSNGAASGNSLQEAVLQGFLELVERDGVALWWYGRYQRPGVDLDSFDEPYLRGLTRHYTNVLNRELWVIDLTTDLQIPTIAAVSRRKDRDEQILFGFGAHLDPRIAILRAVTELNQFVTAVTLLPVDGKNRHGGQGSIDRDLDRWLRTATLAEQKHLMPCGGSPKRFADYHSVCSADLAENLLHCQATVEQLGMEVLFLEQTRPDIGLPVAKVFVPGLRHFWARFARGRLYDIPVRMGWRQESPTEEQLNPIPMFI